MPASLEIAKQLPVPVIKGADIIEFCYIKQILGQLYKFSITVSICVGSFEWFYDQTILGVHHKIPPQIVKHDGVLLTVVLHIYHKSLSVKMAGNI